MLENYLQIETLSVVVVGDLNPIIFQPFWLSSKGLIRENEAKNAKIEVIHNEIVKYELNDWLAIEVTKKRCMLKTSKKPYFGPLKDLAVGIFKILSETPLESFGLNHTYDLTLKTKESYYKFGSSLTPLEYWNENLDDPRLLQLEIFEKERKDGQKGSRRIRISPSQDQSIAFGVAFNINNHFDLISDGKKYNFIKLLEENWNSSFKLTETMINGVLNKAEF